MSKIAPIIFLFSVALAVFSPYLFFGKMPSGEEDIGVYYPAMFFYQNAIRGGDSFLWNSSYYGGFPTFLNFFGGFLYPLHYFLFKFLPLFPAYHIAVFIPVFLGILFSYLFGRANSFSKIGSLILSLAYLLSQTLGGLDTGLSYANGFMVMPLLLFSVAKINQAVSLKRGLLFFLLAVFGLAIGFLAGFPQTVLYGLTFAFAYALFLDFNRQAASVASRFKCSIFLIIAAIFGAVLAFPQILASLEYLPFSVRTAHYTSDVFNRPPILSYLVSFFFPDFFQIPFITSGIAGTYIGVLPLIFAIAAILFFRDRISRFFFFSFVFISAMAVGLPGIAWLNNNLPVFSRISDVGRWFIIGAFPLSFLAAYGYERLLEQNQEIFSKKKFRTFIFTAGIFTVILMISVIILNLVLYQISQNSGWKERLFGWSLSGRSLNLPPEHYINIFNNAIQETKRSIYLGNLEFLLSLILFPASFLVFKFLRHKGGTYAFAFISLLLIIANLFISFGAYFKELVPQTIISEEPIISRVIKERESDLKNFRILSFLTGNAVFHEIASQRKLDPTKRAIINREILANNIGALYGLQNMRGYEPLRTLRSNQLLDTVLAPDESRVFDIEKLKNNGRIDQKVNNEVLRSVSLEEKKKDFLNHLGLISMMNVKYIISFYLLDDSHLAEIKMPLNPHLPIPLHLYENKNFLPRVYFAAKPEFWNGSEDDLLIALSKTSDFKTKTFIECSECGSVSKDAGQNSIDIARYANGKIELSVKSEKGGWLVFSEANITGWVAKVDAKIVPIYPANYLFQSIFIPAGSHSVEFEYISPAKLKLEKLGLLF